jgi:hypothetical protein
MDFLSHQYPHALLFHAPLSSRLSSLVIAIKAKQLVEPQDGYFHLLRYPNALLFQAPFCGLFSLVLAIQGKTVSGNS